MSVCSAKGASIVMRLDHFNGSAPALNWDQVVHRMTAVPAMHSAQTVGQSSFLPFQCLA